MIVYISGRYRAQTINGVYKNIEAARACAADFWKTGTASPLCPHANSAFFDGVCPDENFLRADLEFVEAAHLIVMLPGWKQSEGAKAERTHAMARGIPIFEWLMEGDAPHILADYQKQQRPRPGKIRVWRDGGPVWEDPVAPELLSISEWIKTVPDDGGAKLRIKYAEPTMVVVVNGKKLVGELAAGGKSYVLRPAP